MRRLAGRLLIFLTVLLLLKALVSIGTANQESLYSQPYKDRQFDSLRTTYNAVFVGSSRTFMSVIPGQFDSLSGQTMRSYNYGIGNFFVPHSLALVESLMQRRDIALRYLFLELSLPAVTPSNDLPPAGYMAELGYAYRSGHFYGKLSESGLFMNTYLMSALSPRTMLMDKLVPIPVRRKNPDLIFGGGYDLVPSQTGYLRDKRLHSKQLASELPSLSVSHRLTKEAFRQRQSGPPAAYYQADISRLLALARARHIHLLFYLPNRLTPAEQYCLPAVFNSLPAANRLDILPDQRFDALFSQAYTFDRAHLNHTGAQQYTLLLAEAFRRAGVDTLPRSAVVDPNQPSVREEGFPP
jgi:hypothetical protein